MPDRPRRTLLLRLLVAVAALGALLASNLVSSSSGDLQSQIDASRSAASALKSQIAAESARISQTAGGIEAERSRLSAVQGELDARITELRTVQSNLVASRTRLVALENRLRVASSALAANLVAKYEGNTPDLMSVILESHGFRDLLERVSFLKKIGRQDAVIVGDTRTARTQVTAEVQRLAGAGDTRPQPHRGRPPEAQPDRRDPGRADQTADHAARPPVRRQRPAQRAQRPPRHA